MRSLTRRAVVLTLVAASASAEAGGMSHLRSMEAAATPPIVVQFAPPAKGVPDPSADRRRDAERRYYDAERRRIEALDKLRRDREASREARQRELLESQRSRTGEPGGAADLSGDLTGASAGHPAGVSRADGGQPGAPNGDADDHPGARDQRLARRDLLRRTDDPSLIDLNIKDDNRANSLRARRKAIRAAIRKSRAGRRPDAGLRGDAAASRWDRLQADRTRKSDRFASGFPEWGKVARRNADQLILRTHAGPLVVDRDLRRFKWRAASIDVFRLGNGWTESVTSRWNGSSVATVTDEQGVAIRRIQSRADGQRSTLFNNRPGWFGSLNDLIVEVDPPRVNIPNEDYIVDASSAAPERVYGAATARPLRQLGRRYTLNQVLLNAPLRDHMPRIDLDTITFGLGSAIVSDDQIGELAIIGAALEEAIESNPAEVFLIEGHTDSVGGAMDNIELSHRRAETVAALLSSYFEIPPENLVTQGFGEQFPKVATDDASRPNRRVTVRRITPLLSTSTEIAL